MGSYSWTVLYTRMIVVIANSYVIFRCCFHFIVPPPIEIIVIGGVIQLHKPANPHGIIIYYEIIATKNLSDTTSFSSLNTNMSSFPSSLLLTEPGIYSIKVCTYVCAHVYKK